MSRCMTTGLTSSSSDEWSTPQYVFDILDDEFSFNLDVCATDGNAKCRRYYTKEQDGLIQPWYGVVWCNPPYSRQIGTWMKKAMEYGLGGGIAVCLVPARTDTVWWRECCMNASEIRLVAGRLRFGDAKKCAPFPSAIVIYGTPRSPKISMTEMSP